MGTTIDHYLQVSGTMEIQQQAIAVWKSCIAKFPANSNGNYDLSTSPDQSEQGVTFYFWSSKEGLSEEIIQEFLNFTASYPNVSIHHVFFTDDGDAYSVLELIQGGEADELWECGAPLSFNEAMLAYAIGSSPTPALVNQLGDMIASSVKGISSPSEMAVVMELCGIMIDTLSIHQFVDQSVQPVIGEFRKSIRILIDMIENDSAWMDDNDIETDDYLEICENALELCQEFLGDDETDDADTDDDKDDEDDEEEDE